MGYEEEFNERGGGGMDESDEEYQGDSEEEAQIRKKVGTFRVDVGGCRGSALSAMRQPGLLIPPGPNQ